MAEVVTLDPARLIFAAIAGLVILLVLIIKFKVHAMVSILIGAIAIGLIGGMPAAEIVSAVNDGIGNTLQGIALLIGLGSMFGAILEASGGAQTLAVTMVKKFGDEKAAWALGITGLIVAMPVFFDAGLIILIPLAFSLAKRTRRSTLFYAIPLLAGLAVGHAFIPPTPGPILVASMLGVDLGWVILIGIFCGTVAMIVAGPLWGSFCGKKYMVPVPERISNQSDMDEANLPPFATIVAIILMGAFGPPNSFFATLLTPIFFMCGPALAGTVYSFGYTLLIGVIGNFIFGILSTKLMLKSISRFKAFRKPKLYGGDR